MLHGFERARTTLQEEISAFTTRQFARDQYNEPFFTVS